MEPIVVVHTGDPHGDGKPPSLTMRLFGRIESMTAEAELKKQERPYRIEGSDEIVWRKPDGGVYYLLDKLERATTAILNGPILANGKDAPLSRDTLLLLFDRKYDLPMEIPLPDGSTTTITTSFPFYALSEWSKGQKEFSSGPTSAGSVTQ